MFSSRLTQLPHDSYLNGSRQFSARRTQYNPNGPRIDAAVAGMLPNEYRVISADVSGGLLLSQSPLNGQTYTINDWTPHNAWCPLTQQLITAGHRLRFKVLGYSDLIGEHWEGRLPRQYGNYNGFNHWYGRTAIDQETGWVFLAGWCYNTVTDEIKMQSTRPNAGSNAAVASHAWFPEANNGDGAFLWHGGDWKPILFYSVETDTWTTGNSNSGCGLHALACYHPGYGKVMIAGGTGTEYRAILVNPDGSYVQVADAPAQAHMSSNGANAALLAHPSGCFLLLSGNPSPRRVYAYWPLINTWEEIGPDPTAGNSDAIYSYDYDRKIYYVLGPGGLGAWKFPTIYNPSGTVVPPSLNDGEVVGTPAVVGLQNLQFGSLSSGEVFGEFTVSGPLQVTFLSLNDGEVLGSFTVSASTPPGEVVVPSLNNGEETGPFTVVSHQPAQVVFSSLNAGEEVSSFEVVIHENAEVSFGSLANGEFIGDFAVMVVSDAQVEFGSISNGEVVPSFDVRQLAWTGRPWGSYIRPGEGKTVLTHHTYSVFMTLGGSKFHGYLTNAPLSQTKNSYPKRIMMVRTPNVVSVGDVVVSYRGEKMVLMDHPNHSEQNESFQVAHVSQEYSWKRPIRTTDPVSKMLTDTGSFENLGLVYASMNLGEEVTVEGLVLDQYNFITGQDVRVKDIVGGKMVESVKNILGVKLVNVK